MESAKRIINDFIEFAKRRKLPHAIIKDIPYIGNTLESLIFRGDEKNIDEIIQKFESYLDTKIIPKLQDIIKEYENPINIILVIGSGVLENIYQLPAKTKFQIGKKHIADRKELLGGSGINYTFRLSNTEHIVFPILSIGNDTLGNKIQDNVFIEVNKYKKHIILSSLIKSDDYKCKKLVTPQSTIIVSGEDRTIFTEELKGDYDFYDFVNKQIENIEKIPGLEISAVMIGHIYADDPENNKKLEEPGKITKGIIEKFHNKALIYANFGNSQLKQGFSFWEKYIRDVDIFQLSISEIRNFLSNRKDEKGQDIISLYEIIEFLKRNDITTLITLDKFGAVANCKNGEDGVILCWPFELSDFIDSTGAGDAFRAGMVANLYNCNKFTFGSFFNAIKEARVWSAFACKTLGGSADCPDKSTLNTFKKSTLEFGKLEVRGLYESKFILKLIDRSYS